MSLNNDNEIILSCYQHGSNYFFLVQNRQPPKGSDVVNGTSQPTHCGCCSPSSKYECVTHV